MAALLCACCVLVPGVALSQSKDEQPAAGAKAAPPAAPPAAAPPPAAPPPAAPPPAAPPAATGAPPAYPPHPYYPPYPQYPPYPPRAPAPPPPKAAPPPAQPPPPQKLEWWDTYQPEPRSRSPRVALAASGGVLAGLGLAGLFGAGITWLAAWSEARGLEDECPGGLCYEGTPGGDSYVSARDTAYAADVVAGVSTAAFGTGVILLLLAAGTRGTDKAWPIDKSEHGLVVRF